MCWEFQKHEPERCGVCLPKDNWHLSAFFTPFFELKTFNPQAYIFPEHPNHHHINITLYHVLYMLFLLLTLSTEEKRVNATHHRKVNFKNVKYKFESMHYITVRQVSRSYDYIMKYRMICMGAMHGRPWYL